MLKRLTTLIHLRILIFDFDKMNQTQWSRLLWQLVPLLPGMKSQPLLPLFIVLLCWPFFSVVPQDQYPKYEFRAVWIATVVNIDWPREPGLSVGQQKKEFLDILDFYQKLNFNAVIVQVRAAGDAFYPSTYEPWSKYLTGTEGTAPDPYYDPLEWMISEAHQRGLEFHAWFNPYRATFNKDTLELAANHAFHTHHDWMISYGKRYYFNPGLPEVRQYTTDVIMEVVNQYNIDGVHFDDYFYPYKVAGEVFADSITFVNHGNDIEPIEDWRRANVDSLIKDISDSIRAVKPWVQFGISPFGVWRNASVDSLGSDTRAGQTTYDDLYADPLKWMEEKWIDNIIPQLYWNMDYPPASHRKLVKWWAEQDYEGHLYIGHGAYKVKNNKDKAWKKYREIPMQVDLARSTTEVNGSVYFSAKTLQRNHKPLVRRLKKRKYRYPALRPPAPFMEKETPDRPVLSRMDTVVDRIDISFNHASDMPVKYLLVYGVKKNKKPDLNDITSLLFKEYVGIDMTCSVSLNKKDMKKLSQLMFTFIDRYGHESDPYVVELEKSKDAIISEK